MTTAPLTTVAPRTRLLALVIASVVWGSSFLFGKIALEEITAPHVVLQRFAIGCGLLLPFAVARRSFPRRADLPLFLAAGVVGVPLTFLLQFEGLARTTVTSASLIVGAGAPLVALGAAAFDGDRLDRSGWWAVALSTAGVALLVGLPGPGRTLLGDGLVLGSMVAAAAYLLLCVRLLRRYDAFAATVWSLTAGTLVLAPIAWIVEGPPLVGGLSSAVVASVVVLGVGCTAGTYLLWNWGLARVPASRAGVYLNLEPLVGALLGVALLGDPVTVGLLLGGAAILVASIRISLPSGGSGSALDLTVRRASRADRVGSGVAASRPAATHSPRPHRFPRSKEPPCLDPSSLSAPPRCCSPRRPRPPRRPRCPTRSATRSAGRTRPASSTPCG